MKPRNYDVITRFRNYVTTLLDWCWNDVLDSEDSCLTGAEMMFLECEDSCLTGAEMMFP
jgi:hypothetical protein